MGKSDQDLFKTISSCYQAAWDDQLWSDALANLCNYINAKSATLEGYDLRSGHPSHFYSTGINDASVSDYINYYLNVNPRHNYLLSTMEGDIGFDHQLLSEKEMDNNEFYTDLLRPDDLRYFISSTLIKNQRRILLLAPHRTPRQGHANKHDVKKMQRISPFVRQAFELGERIGSLHSQHDSFFQSLYHHQSGIIIIDVSIKVHFINMKAQQMLREDSGLKLISRRLEFKEHGHQSEFEKLLLQVFHPESINTSGRMWVKNNGSSQVLIFDVAPLLAPKNTNDHLKLSHKQSYAIITLRDNQNQVGLTNQLLCDCYGLTPRECQIARDLLEGISFKQICRRDEVAMTTVRSHYANLRAKLGAHNRAEVILLLLPLSLQ